MITVNKSKRVRCPQCRGRGVVEIPDSRKDGTWQREESEEYSEEQRLPNLTGTKDQCIVAMNIRNIFVQKAKKQYQAESFKTFRASGNTTSLKVAEIVARNGMPN